MTKGQIISKWLLVSSDSSKKERTISFLLVCDLFSSVFWKKFKKPKRHFEIILTLTMNLLKKQKTGLDYVEPGLLTIKKENVIYTQ